MPVLIVLVCAGRPAPSIALCDAALPEIAARGVPVPTYDRRRLEPRILHVGVGGFHRAHLALYTHELAETGSDWGIRGLGLLRQDVRMADALAPQDHLYTLVERGAATPAPTIVGSIIDYRLAHDQPRRGRRARGRSRRGHPLAHDHRGGLWRRRRGTTSSPPTTFDVIADGPRATARARPSAAHDRELRQPARQR